MDVGELLSFKPVSTPKRHAPGDLDEDEEEQDYSKQKKLKKLMKLNKMAEAEKAEQERLERLEKERTRKEEEQDMILKLVESSEPQEDDILNENTLKRMLLLFEKRALKNQEMRIKFPDSPEKFMESEVELHEVIQEMHAIATVPDLYPIMVQLNSIPSLLELLSHENSDISVAVVDLLQELTDVDILNESAEGAEALVECLLSQQATSLLLHNLQRLDENVKEEADGVHNTLAIIENLVELRPQLVSEVGKQEHVVSIIASMLRNCRGAQRSRLLSKFSENDHEKVDRLLELHFKYMEKVDVIDIELENRVKKEQLDEDEMYLKRLEGGLFTLQLIDYIMLEVCAGSSSSVKQRVTLILNQRGASLKTIRHIMREYAGNLGDEGDSEWKEQEQQHILQLVDKF
ncbi:unnamed protein product [Nezara viridula]|uniref:Beta-catenin-like protein 1 n=1 Tax=Nezara viridula TaxID=85310 RepID=A0A9P0HIS2_NEZVI|nr:unnamed protein product [Nezara viridula]